MDGFESLKFLDKYEIEHKASSQLTEVEEGDNVELLVDEFRYFIDPGTLILCRIEEIPGLSLRWRFSHGVKYTNGTESDPMPLVLDDLEVAEFHGLSVLYRFMLSFLSDKEVDIDFGNEIRPYGMILLND